MMIVTNKVGGLRVNLCDLGSGFLIIGKAQATKEKLVKFNCIQI